MILGEQMLEAATEHVLGVPADDDHRRERHELACPGPGRVCSPARAHRVADPPLVGSPGVAKQGERSPASEAAVKTCTARRGRAWLRSARLASPGGWGAAQAARSCG